MEFIKEVYNELPFKLLIIDNRREFDNNNLKEWTNNKKISYNPSLPYMHQSNGRVEKAIRTIREALRRTKGSTKGKLTGIVENYNKTYHRAIVMSPDEARKEENQIRLKENINRYMKESKPESKGCIKFKIGDEVILEHKTKKAKMDDEFKEEGRIQKILRKNTHVITKENKRASVRHVSQLKLLARGKLDHANLENTESKSINLHKEVINRS